jgi:phosphoenolpyruvate-protein kinase (PTS system EI component)
MEIDELSMSPSILPEIKKIVRSLAWRGIRTLSRQVLQLNSHAEVLAFAQHALQQRVEEIPY